MVEKKIDDAPFLSKMENFEISDKKGKGSKKDVKNEYKSLNNEFHFDEEKGENDEEDKDKDMNEGDVNKNHNKKENNNIRMIQIDRKNLKKMFSSQFFTQTLTDDSSSNSVSELKVIKKYACVEFFKMLFLVSLFFVTSYYSFIYIYNNFMGTNHICGSLDMYNYKYEESVKFISSISNNKYYIFTGKFPFDVITYKLRKEALKNSMNEEIKKYNESNANIIYDNISNLDDHQIQIISFNKYNNKMKCEKNIFDLYKPFYLKTTDAPIKNMDYIYNEVNYNSISNPYNIAEKKLFSEVSTFMKTNEKKNKICFITSYLKSLKDEDTSNFNNAIVENNNNNSSINNYGSNPSDEKNQQSEENNNRENYLQNNNNEKKYFKNTNSIGDNDNKKVYQESNVLNFNYSNNMVPEKKKIIFLYDQSDNNFVDLVIAIYSMQYGNTYNNLKDYWEEIRKKFKVIHAEEIYLFEWYCLGINFNLIENNNQYKLKCVDLLK
ncbi:hypothetical protein PGSY75_0815500 [Plasmodium gaboni]|uniref:Uncharacterized protein n=1 Tax=Plasmodium gaboni TaxID=647221 RepID=A0A151LNI8_9APIC|nr:hypothetical protein PGSY75_0815500 [Plasmodium gaboni]KYO00748.1 hypothetical protein PGSY75_0815500 [Plasmodium gaboni]